MELGLEFDDEDYDVQKKAKRAPLQSYNAKVCNPLWFQDGSSLGDQDWEQVSNVLRLQADHAYSLGEFENAYHKYNEALGLSSNSSAMQRHFLESKTRCLLHLGRLQECRQAAQLLMLESNNSDQERQAQLLLTSVCLAQRDFAAAETVLHSLITSEPDYAHFWLQLADIYQGMQQRESSAKTGDTTSKEAGSFPLPQEEEYHCTDTASNLSKNCSTKVETEDFQAALSNNKHCVKRPQCSLTNTRKSKVSQKCSDCGSVEINSCGCSEVSSHSATSEQIPVECKANRDGGGGDEQNCISDSMKTLCCVTECREVDAGHKDPGKEDADSLQLMEFSCLVRARTLLQSVEGSVGGLVQSRNQALIAKIQKRMDGMACLSSVVEKAQQFMGQCARPDEGRSSESSETSADQTPDKADKSADFRTTWFSWIHSQGDLRL